MLADALPAPRVRIVRGATVLPARDRPDSPHGVFDRQHQFAPLSQTRLSRGRISGVPTVAPAEALLDGTHLYGGIARKHIGHFLLEGCARAWALAHTSDPVDGIVMTPVLSDRVADGFAGRTQELADHLFDGRPVHLLDRPTKVQRLVLAAQGFGHGPWIGGTPEFRAYVRARFSHIRPDGPSRLYITRRHLGRRKEHVDREIDIEDMMEQAGYTLFAPEQHSIAAQCAAYKAADVIVGADGSAFHIVPMVLRRDARVAIFLRRDRPEILKLLAAQMRAFAGVAPTTIDPRTRPLSPEIAPTLLDMSQLRIALRAGGFL